MSEFSRILIDRSGYDAEGFPEVYDRSRPSPPPELLEILMVVAQVTRPRLVVDLGAGTGLSTRVWAERAEEVIGVEPNARMVEQARLATQAPNVHYVEAFAANTALGEGSADLVTCAQAFHWMEPAPVLAEAGRILRRGGVFAAYDYDVPPVIHPEVDEAFGAHFAARQLARQRLELHPGAATWPKESHLERIRDSGQFRFVRELVCHGFDRADAARIMGLAQSVGGPRTLFDGEEAEVEQTFDQLREAAQRELGEQSRPMVICYRVRLGVK